MSMLESLYENWHKSLSANHSIPRLRLDSPDTFHIDA